ncbi:MAG: hypothetical protein ABI407_17440 [Bradyrhizobium sp.]
MPDRSPHFIARVRTAAATAGAALLMLAAAIGAAWPQAVPPPAPTAQSGPAAPDQPAPPQGAPAAPAREENPGLINQIGKMFEKLPTLKSPSETIDDINARARDAADTFSRLTRPLIVTGRMICPVSANGAPDCKAASDKLCQAKGFKEGKSLASDSAETCSAKVLIPGRTRKPGDCRTDTYVTSALCR